MAFILPLALSLARKVTISMGTLAQAAPRDALLALLDRTQLARVANQAMDFTATNASLQLLPVIIWTLDRGNISLASLAAAAVQERKMISALLVLLIMDSGSTNAIIPLAQQELICLPQLATLARLAALLAQELLLISALLAFSAILYPEPLAPLKELVLMAGI